MTVITDTERFCKGCNKLVHDFTKKEKPDDFSGCGHFRIDQVSSIKNQIFMSSVAAISTSLLSLIGIPSYAQTALPAIPQEKSSRVLTKTSTKVLSKVKIEGQVLNKDSEEVLPAIQVILHVQEAIILETLTDSSGNFSLEIDTLEIPIKQLELSFEAFGYLEKTIKLSEIQESQNVQQLQIDLVSTYIMEEVELWGKEQVLISPEGISGGCVPRKKITPVPVRNAYKID